MKDKFIEWKRSLDRAEQWAHCGKTKHHEPHLHTIHFNEGPYPDVPCVGTPKFEKEE